MPQMIDIYLQNVESGCESLNDSQLFSALIFAKKSIEGGLSYEDFNYLEGIRNKLNIDSQIVFAGLLERIKIIYQNHYFNRIKN